MKQQSTGLIRRLYERAKRQEGLTFVELVITVVILGMITAATAAAFGVSIQASSSANDRIKKTNDSQALATFLQRDAASAGGYDERNALVAPAGTQPSATQPSPGVDTDGADKGFCNQAGSRVRFEWLERGSATSITRVVANYGLDGDTQTLTRHYCTQAMTQTAGANGAFVLTPTGGITETSAPLGKHIAGASAVCSPECTPANRLPATVSLAITAAQGSGDSTPYTYTLSGFVRTGGASAQTNPESVPLITLGIPTGGNCAAQPYQTTAGSSIAVSGTNGSNVTVDGIAAINTAGTGCGPVLSLPAPISGRPRLNTTQTLLQDGTNCANPCGPVIRSNPLPDPYAGVVAAPSTSACGTAGSNPAPSVSGLTRTYSPGTYRQRLDLGATTPDYYRFLFQPGVYVFCNGMTVQSGTTVAMTGTGGVLFYFHGGSLRRASGGAVDPEYNDVHFILSGRPEFRNIVIWQPNPSTSSTATTGDLQISTGDNQCRAGCEGSTAPFRSNIDGVIYAPRAQVELFFPFEQFPSGEQNQIRNDLPVVATIGGIVARNLTVGAASAARIGPGPQTTTTLTASPNPSNVGDIVTLRAVVAPVAPATGTPTRTVTFYDNSEALGSAELVNGVAELPVTTIGGGNRELQAIYSGDDTFGASASPIINQTGNAAGSTTVVSTSANPSGEGQPLTIRATVTGPGPVATGNVTFSIDGNTVGTYPLVGGVASFVNTTLPQGTHTIVAQYLGSATYNPSQGTYTQEVREGTILVLTSTPNPSDPGQSVTLTAVISSTGGSPVAGTVNFVDGLVNLGTATVVGGQAQLVTTALVTPGLHTLTATYIPSGPLAGSNGTRAHTVDQANTTTLLTSNPNPSASGANVTLTATVTSAVGGAGTPAGQVTFRDGTTTLGTANLNGAGVATLVTNDISTGTRTLTAVYAGNATFNGSSDTHTHTVAGVQTTVTLTRNPSGTVDIGEDVDFFADVSAPGPDPTTGSVTLFVDGNEYATVGNIGSDNTAVFNNLQFGVGPHSIYAVYNGANGYAPGTSNTITFTVAGYPTQITLTRTGGPNPSSPGEQVTFRAQITDSGPGSPTGEIIFRDNGQEIGRGTISGGQVFLSTSSLTLGDHPITAVYEGGGNFAGSTSNTVNHSVRRGTVVAVTSAPNPSNQGQNVTFTATVTSPTGGGTPTGSVEFFDNGNLMGSSSLNGSGVATLVRNNLSGGAHTITAEYNPSGTTFAGSTSPGHTHNVNRTATAVSWVTGGFSGTGPNPSSRGGEVTFTVRVQAGATNVNGGSVSFYDGSTLLATDNTVNNGVFTIDWTFNSAGVRSITAVYSGNTTYEPSTSPVWTQTVNGTPTNVILTRSPNSNTGAGQSVTFTADVDENVTGTPSGQVEFYDNGVLVFTANLSGGVGTWTTTSLSVGTHPIMARYLGDSNFAPDDSSTLNHTVVVLGPAPTITSISPNNINGPNFGSQNFTFTVNGTNLQPGVVLTITAPGGCNNGITPNNGGVASSVNGARTQATFSINVSSQASTSSSCLRTITVRNPDNQTATLASALDID